MKDCAAMRSPVYKDSLTTASILLPNPDYPSTESRHLQLDRRWIGDNGGTVWPRADLRKSSSFLDLVLLLDTSHLSFLTLSCLVPLNKRHYDEFH